MKNNSSFRNFLIAIGLLTLGLAHSQNNKTVFGKQKKTENTNNGYIRCATTEYEKFLQEKNPNRTTETQFEAWIAPLIKRYQFRRTTSQTDEIITIPVVVHVIHSGQAIGTAPNITDAQVQSQIKVLNEDYRKISGTPGDNTNPVGADTQIQFALALQDPNGNPTNGIDRISYCQDTWSSTEFDSKIKPATIWDPNSYMNMWCVNFSDNTLLGYAQPPDASGLPGLDTSGGNANSDGVVSSYKVFGSKNYDDGTFLLISPFDKGRTMSHETGHWLGLRHIWGDSTCGNDYCTDTPKHHDANYGCPTVVNCDANGNEMVQNYMDYTDDSCMNLFTQNQKDRLITVMNNSPRRTSLKTSTKNTPIPLFANDAEIKLESSCPTPTCGIISDQATQKITIYNRGTNNLTSAALTYSVNGGANTNYNWTGNLATNISDTFEVLLNSSVNGTINVVIDKANDTTDERNTNNAVTGTFTLPTTPNNYTFNNLVFRLQQDKYGSETTWQLKNDSETVLYYGGPYTDTHSTPALITMNWVLENNQCYTFTINDKEGDGICCGSDSGNGYYDIKSSNGVVIASGASFATTESKTFSINLDGTVIADHIDFYVYPNPAKDLLTIKITTNNGSSSYYDYTISNSRGQIIQTQTIFTEKDLIVNTTSWSSGVYFISLTKEGMEKTLRFIKK